MGGKDGWTDKQAQTNLPLQLLLSWGHNNALMCKLCPWQAQFMVILSFDLQVWPWPSTYVNKSFERHFSWSKTTTVQLCKIILKSMHKYTSYGPDKLNLWSFLPLFDPYDFDLQPTWNNVSNGISPNREQQLCNIILKYMHRCTSYCQDKLNIWPYWPLFDPWPWPSTYLKKCLKWHFSSWGATTVHNYFEMHE